MGECCRRLELIYLSIITNEAGLNEDASKCLNQTFDRNLPCRIRLPPPSFLGLRGRTDSSYFNDVFFFFGRHRPDTAVYQPEAWDFSRLACQSPRTPSPFLSSALIRTSFFNSAAPKRMFWVAATSMDCGVGRVFGELLTEGAGPKMETSSDERPPLKNDDGFSSFSAR